MKHALLYTRLLGTLLSAAAHQLYADDAANVNLASYNPSNPTMQAAKADPAMLKKIFHTSQFNVIDPMNEFSGRDWNRSTPLGATVTHEMREAQERVAPKMSAATSFEEEARAGLY